MLEHPSTFQSLGKSGVESNITNKPEFKVPIGDNMLGADNQQGSPLGERLMTPQRLHAGQPQFLWLMI